MAEQPYTDEDLRAEAARQHAVLTDDPDFMGVGERMDREFIDSTIVDPDPETGTEKITGRTWDALDGPQFERAQRAIDDLIGGAADVSRWAVDIGADDLEPVDGVLAAQTSSGPLFRIYIAVRKDMPDRMRADLVEGLGMEIAKHL